MSKIRVAFFAEVLIREFDGATRTIFEIIDSNGNAFTSNTLSIENLKIIDTDDQSEIDFHFITTGNLNLISVGDIGWGTQQKNYQFKADETVIFNIYIDSERVSENCCSFTRYNEISITGTTYTVNEETGVYEILINP